MHDMNKRLGFLLKKKGLISGTKLVRALDQQKLHGGKLGQILVEQGAITEDDLVRALHECYEVPIIDLNRAPQNHNALKLIPQNLATQLMALPITFIKVPKGFILVVAMEDPTEKESIQRLHKQTGYPIKPMLAGRMQLLSAIAESYRNIHGSH